MPLSVPSKRPHSGVVLAAGLTYLVVGSFAHLTSTRLTGIFQGSLIVGSFVFWDALFVMFNTYTPKKLEVTRTVVSSVEEL